MPGSIRASPAEPLEDALDEAEFVLALMTSGSYVSDICRAEQLRALRKDKCLIPLKAQSGADVPLHLEAKNYRDFTADSRYPQAFTELLADLHAGNGIALKPEFRETSYVTVPPLPVNFVERPEALAALRDVLIADDGGRHIALTALQGMGGIGKTVLAQALCHARSCNRRFPMASYGSRLARNRPSMPSLACASSARPWLAHQSQAGVAGSRRARSASVASPPASGPRSGRWCDDTCLRRPNGRGECRGAVGRWQTCRRRL